ncbi:Rho GTPase activation protein, partial [Nadsonia fulvescens var. elongata DSM 6958]
MNLLLSTSCSKDISLRFKSSISQDDSFIGEASIKLDYLGLKVLAPNHYEHLEAMIHDLSTNMCSRIANRFLSTPILLSDLGSSLNSLADSCTVISGDNPQNNSSLSDSKKGHASKSLFFSSLSTLQGISSLLLKINMSLGCAEAWLISLIDQEVNQISPLAKPDVNSSVTASPKLKTGIQSALNSLFRGNTLMSKCIDYYMQIVGLEFLQKYIQPITDEIINDRIILEIDPNRLDSSEATAEISENKKRLLKYVELTWSNIRLNIENLPLSIKRILSHLRHKLEETLSFEENTEDARGEIQSKNGVIFNCLSAFIFLRFLCPAILNPKLFGLSQV